MNKKTGNDDSELEEFYQSLSGVKPYAHDKVQLKPNKPLVIRQPQQEDTPQPLILLDDLAPVTAESPVSFKRPAVSHKILRNLKKGQYNIDLTLDLHGMTVTMAETALLSTIETCLEVGDRVLLIVHGKSRHQEMPIIKNRLNHWLRQLDTVLAFCSATNAHGGRGSVYVLLKKIDA